MDNRFGNKLRELRESKCYSIFQLSKLSRISPSEIAELEQGKRKPQATTIAKLAEALSVSRTMLIDAMEPNK